jgi:hypothetical protein
MPKSRVVNPCCHHTVWKVSLAATYAAQRMDAWLSTTGHLERRWEKAIKVQLLGLAPIAFRYAKKKWCRREQDSNLCAGTALDFKSNSLTTRTPRPKVVSVNFDYFKFGTECTIAKTTTSGQNNLLRVATERQDHSKPYKTVWRTTERSLSSRRISPLSRSISQPPTERGRSAQSGAFSSGE